MLSSYLEANAKWAASVLRILGQESDVIDNRVIAPGFTLTILAECTASGLFSFLVAGILAFPTPAVRKMAGIALCMVTIAFLNLVRILTLFLAGVWQPRLFDLLHEDIWPVVFIITTFALALTWVRWISADRLPSSEKRPCGKTSSALF
ncbi:hypothetical protein OPIT5_01585 [Opitutaceae bacterium TAV5]|nr:hypothetical protein OPIT5_01585 [Opitutaceae bacterium TAV5]